MPPELVTIAGQPDIYVVSTVPITNADREVMREKPAKLDLAGMRASLQKDAPPKGKVD